jgi:hypothetical protein
MTRDRIFNLRARASNLSKARGTDAQLCVDARSCTRQVDHNYNFGILNIVTRFSSRTRMFNFLQVRCEAFVHVSMHT